MTDVIHLVPIGMETLCNVIILLYLLSWLDLYNHDIMFGLNMLYEIKVVLIMWHEQWIWLCSAH